MMQCSVYIASSLDGFIAGPNGEIDWLDRPEYVNAPMRGLQYEDFIETIDVLLMGRNSFDKVLSLGSWLYDNVPVRVLTHRPLVLPEGFKADVDSLAGEPEEIVARFEADGVRHIYVDGGITIQAFLAAKLINTMTITLIPELLGRGIPLFGRLDRGFRLKLLDAAASVNGFVQVQYEVLYEQI